jgi:hypothetical protein
LAGKLLPFLQALQDLLVELVEAEAPRPRPAPPKTPAPGHASYLVLKPGGWTDFCCAAHEAEFERNVARYGQPPPLLDALAGPQRRYIRERLGVNPRDFPGPQR